MKTTQHHRQLHLVPFLTALLLLLGFPGLTSAAHDWQKPGIQLGSLQADGTLHRSFPLGRLGGSPEFGFLLRLEHHTLREAAADGGEEARSHWTIPQLETFLIPQNRRRIIWQQPGGTTFHFDRRQLTEENDSVQSGEWTLTRLSEEDQSYSISHPSGWTYHYEGGAIQRLQAPTGRVLHFQSEGAFITRITQRAHREHYGDRTLELLRAHWRDGKITRLKLGPAEHLFSWDTRRDQLRAWNHGVDEDVEFEYNEHGLLSLIRDVDGRESLFTWRTGLRSWMRVAGMRLPDDVSPAVLASDDHWTYRFGLAREGLLLSRTDADGRRESLSFNPRRNELTRTAFDGSQMVHFYNPERMETGAGKLRSVFGPMGEELVRMEYDQHDRVIERRQLGRPALHYQYDDLDRLTAVERKGQTMLQLFYEGDGKQPTEVVNPMGDCLRMAYDEHGQLTSMEDLRGGQHKFHYNEFGWVTRHDYPMGYHTEARYDDHGRIEARRGLDGRTVRVEFNDRNRVAGVRTDDHYWRYHYNRDTGHLERLTRNGQHWFEWQRVTRHIEGGERLAVVQTDPVGNQSSRVFDTQGNLTHSTNALGETIEYRYSPAGHLEGWTDARGSLVEFERDIMGRLLSQKNSVGQEQHWDYDASGRLTERRTGEQHIRYQYDRAGQLTAVDYGDGQLVEFQRDDLGRIVRASTAEVTTDYAFDEMDRIIGIREKLPDGTVQGLGYKYTAAGQKKAVGIFRWQNQEAPRLQQVAWHGSLTEASDALMQVTEYEYDQLGRVTGLIIDGVREVEYRYDAESLRLAQRKFANGVVVNYAYDRQGRPTHMLASNSQTRELLKQVAWEWDDLGRMVHRNVDGLQQDYRYDRVGRLLEVKAADRPDLHEAYEYDASGNIVRKIVGGREVTMEYDLANQLVRKVSGADGGTSSGMSHYSKTHEFQYDSAGRMIAELVGDVEVATYRYGYLDKVMEVTRPGRSAEFFYNAGGMMSAKEVAGEVEPWMWDGIALAARGDELYGNEGHISGGVAVVARSAGDLDSQYLVNDYLGTTMGTFGGDSGQATTTLTAAYGDSSEALSGVERFTGKPFDPDLGAHVFPFRNYRPELGRWMSADPAGFPDGPNGQFYAPVPTHGLDPLGLSSTDLKIVPGPLSPAQLDTLAGGTAGNIIDGNYQYASEAVAAVKGLITTALGGTQTYWQENTITFSADFNMQTATFANPTAEFTAGGNQSKNYSAGGTASWHGLSFGLQMSMVLTAEFEMVNVSIVGQGQNAEGRYYADIQGTPRATVALQGNHQVNYVFTIEVGGSYDIIKPYAARTVRVWE